MIPYMDGHPPRVVRLVVRDGEPASVLDERGVPLDGWWEVELRLRRDEVPDADVSWTSGDPRR